MALKAAFRPKRKHHQNLGRGANPGVLQPQQIPSQDQSLGVARSPRYSSCYRAPSPHGPQLITSTRGHAQLQANTLVPGVSSTCNPQRVTALAPPPSSACKDGTNGGVRAGRSSQTLPSPDSAPLLFLPLSPAPRRSLPTRHGSWHTPLCKAAPRRPGWTRPTCPRAEKSLVLEKKQNLREFFPG